MEDSRRRDYHCVNNYPSPTSAGLRPRLGYMLLFSPALLVRLFLGGAVAIGGLAAYGATLLLEKPDAMKVVAALAVMGLIGTLVALLLVIFSGIITPLLKAHWSSKVSFILFDTL